MHSGMLWCLWRCVVGAGAANGAGLERLMLHMKFTAGGEFFECAAVTDLMMSRTDVAVALLGRRCHSDGFFCTLTRGPARSRPGQLQDRLQHCQYLSVLLRQPCRNSAGRDHICSDVWSSPRVRRCRVLGPALRDLPCCTAGKGCKHTDKWPSSTHKSQAIAERMEEEADCGYVHLLLSVSIFIDVHT